MPGGVNQAMFVRVLAVLALGVSLVALSHYDCKSWVQSMIEWHPHSTKGGTLSFCELEEEEALCTEGEDGDASCGESTGNEEQEEQEEQEGEEAKASPTPPEHIRVRNPGGLDVRGGVRSHKDFNDCQSCVAAGYGWCPIRRKCGYFQTKICSGTATDKRKMAVQAIGDETYEEVLYNPVKTTFLLLHAGEEQVKAFSHVVENIRGDTEGVAAYFSMDVTKHRALVKRYKFRTVRLPALKVFHRTANAQHQEHMRSLAESGDSATTADDLGTDYWRSETRLPHSCPHARRALGPSFASCINAQLLQANARVPQLDALVPRYMTALTQGDKAGMKAMIEEAEGIIEYMVDAGFEDAEAAKIAKLQQLNEELVQGLKDMLDADGDGVLEEGELDPSEQEELVAVQRGAFAAKLKVSAPEYVKFMKRGLNEGLPALVRRMNGLRVKRSRSPQEVREHEVLDVFMGELF